MTKTLVSSVVLMSVCFPGSQDSAHWQEKSLLQLRLSSVRLAQEAVPLSTALEEVGIRIRNGYVLFGIEVQLEAGKEPTVDLDIPPDSTLGDALRQVFQQLPTYRYDVVGERLINVYPAGADKDPQNVLNTPVEQFDIKDEQATSVLGAPQLFVNELKRRLTPPTAEQAPQPGGSVGPRLRGTTPGVTLHLKNVTVREILNAVSGATEHFPPDHSPLGWVYYFQPEPSWPAGGSHRWKFHLSTPTNWKKAPDA